MKKARFTEEQIIGVLREHEAGSVTSEVCRKRGISSATFYKWKAKYGGLDVSEARRLRSLEDENRRLEKLLAETMLDNAMLKDCASKKCVMPAARREAAAHLCSVHEVSQRRACRTIGVEWALVRTSTGRPGRPRALARVGGDRRRFGWRRLQVLLSRQGVHMYHKKLRRLNTEERLQVRRRIGRKRAAVTRAPLVAARAPNQRWSIDFVHDALSDDRRFRILSRRRLHAGEPVPGGRHLAAGRVIRELGGVIARRGCPGNASRTMVASSTAWRCSAGGKAWDTTGTTLIPAAAAECLH